MSQTSTSNVNQKRDGTDITCGTWIMIMSSNLAVVQQFGCVQLLRDGAAAAGAAGVRSDRNNGRTSGIRRDCSAAGVLIRGSCNAAVCGFVPLERASSRVAK